MRLEAVLDAQAVESVEQLLRVRVATDRLLLHQPEEDLVEVLRDVRVLRADARHRVRVNYRDFRDDWNDADQNVG